MNTLKSYLFLIRNLCKKKKKKEICAAAFYLRILKFREINSSMIIHVCELPQFRQFSPPIWTIQTSYPRNVGLEAMKVLVDLRSQTSQHPFRISF